MTQELKNKLHTIELELRELEPLFLQGYSYPESYVEHIENLLSSTKIHSSVTKHGNQQCRYGKNRSFGDLYRLVISKYNVSFTEFLYIILGLVNLENNISYIFCPDILKRVLVTGASRYGSHVLNSIDNDDLNISHEDLQSIREHTPTLKTSI